MAQLRHNYGIEPAERRFMIDGNGIEDMILVTLYRLWPRTLSGQELCMRKYGMTLEELEEKHGIVIYVGKETNDTSNRA